MQPTILLTSISLLALSHLTSAHPLPSGFLSRLDDRDVYVMSPRPIVLRVNAAKQHQSEQQHAQTQNQGQHQGDTREQAQAHVIRIENPTTEDNGEGEGRIAKRDVEMGKGGMHGHFDQATYKEHPLAQGEEKIQTTAQSQPADGPAVPNQKINAVKKKALTAIAVLAVIGMAVGTVWWQKHPNDSYKLHESWGY